MADQYELALGHLQAAMTIMAACQDTLAVAIIAQAVSVVERAKAGGRATPISNRPAANRRPC